MLKKARLPLGVLIHPFKDLSHLPVIQCTTIVRCRSCRTYINPFVHFVDQRRWRCNLCYRSVIALSLFALTNNLIQSERAAGGVSVRPRE